MSSLCAPLLFWLKLEANLWQLNIFSVIHGCFSCNKLPYCSPIEQVKSRGTWWVYYKARHQWAYNILYESVTNKVRKYSNQCHHWHKVAMLLRTWPFSVKFNIIYDYFTNHNHYHQNNLPVNNTRSIVSSIHTQIFHVPLTHSNYDSYMCITKEFAYNLNIFSQNETSLAMQRRYKPWHF